MNHIQYVDTYHQCHCTCGEDFFVAAGRARPASIATQCPGCGITEMIQDRYDKHKLLVISVDTRIALPRYLHEDLTDLEQDLKTYQKMYQLAANHLAGLQSAVRKTIKRWDQDWSRSVMPLQFRELIRVMNEQSQDVLENPS